VQWTLSQTYYFSENLVAPGIEPGLLERRKLIKYLCLTGRIALKLILQEQYKVAFHTLLIMVYLTALSVNQDNML
jgi:hypothetical protein